MKFSFSQAAENQNMVVLYQSTVGAIIVTFLLFIYCWLGSIIALSALQINNAIYNSIWYSQSIDVQKSILLMIIRSQKPFYLTGYHMLRSSLEDFGNVNNLFFHKSLLPMVKVIVHFVFS